MSVENKIRNFELNFQTNEIYTDHSIQISKNSSVKVQRAPLGRRAGSTPAYTVKMPKKVFEIFFISLKNISLIFLFHLGFQELSVDELRKVPNLAAVEADEENKIKVNIRSSRKYVNFNNEFEIFKNSKFRL